MSKLEELRRRGGANANESMGVGLPMQPHSPGIGGPPPPPTHLQGLVRRKDVAEIPVDKIVRDEAQPREEFDPEGLQRLAESLKARGQLQPARVRLDAEKGVYVLMCGERRFRAAKLAGLPTLACVISAGTPTPAELLIDAITENLQREDLRPIEQARAYRTLMDLNGWSGNRLAQELSVTQPSVVKALSLLDLPSLVQERVERDELSPATAYVISQAPAESQEEIAAKVVEGGLTRDETADLVKSSRARTPAARGEDKASDGKGRGGKPSRTVVVEKPRTFRTAAGKVTVEPKPKAGANARVAALLEALRQETGVDYVPAEGEGGVEGEQAA